MNSVLLLIIGIPLIEIFLFIKVGSYLGAFNTISLILITAFIGVMYARYEGFNTIKSGMSQMMKNEIPVYEMISGASIGMAALLLIIPGFFSDLIGFLLLIPFTRKILINFYIKKNKISTYQESTNTLDGEIIENKDKKDEL